MMTNKTSQDSGPALGLLLNEHRDKLNRMIRCRMDRRLQGRVDPSDVLQEACVEAVKRYSEFQQQTKMPFYLWLRFLTLQQLMIVHRKHLNVKMRSITSEDRIVGDLIMAPNVAALAEMLSGTITSPSSAFQKKELQVRLHAAL